MNSKGLTFKVFLVFVLVVSIAGYLTFYFIKKLTTSADKLAQESAGAIYETANLYYINTMMLLNTDEYKCNIKKKNCDELKFNSTTKPIDGYINIYKGKVNARLIYQNNIEYYICNNVVTQDKECILNQYGYITLRNLQDFYYKNRNQIGDGYSCDFSTKKCDDTFNEMFEHTGNIIIDRKGNIEADLSIGDYKYYICNSVSKDKECLNIESIKKIIDSLKDYHNAHNKEQKYNGFKCNVENCGELKYMTLTHSKGEVVLDKNGKVNGELIYNDKTYYICNDDISKEKCK